MIIRWYHRKLLRHWQTHHEIGRDRWIQCKCGMRWVKP